MTGRVDQVEDVRIAGWADVGHADCGGLDRYPALTFEIHTVEVLGVMAPGGQYAGDLEHAVGQRGLAVVDVRHGADVPDVGDVGHVSRPNGRLAGLNRLTQGQAITPK